MSPINFLNGKVAFAYKSNASLLRGILVLLWCQEPIVLNAPKLLLFSRSILGKQLTAALVRHTFFKVFCAGETEQEAKQLMKNLAKYNVGGILDFAAEADLEKALEFSHHEELVTSREYKYESERQCEVHMNNFLKCVDAAEPGGFAAVKVTALGDAETIKTISLCVLELQSLFQRQFPSGQASQEEFDEFVTREFNHPQELFASISNKIGRQDGGSIDILDWLSFITPKEYVNLKIHYKAKHFTWTSTENDKMERMLKRMDKIAQQAKNSSKKVMIDAEQTYFQPAIDSLTLELQRMHNTEKPIVFATIQAYLKDSEDRISMALEFAKREKWIYACKVVRGAYLVQERALASLEHRPSPVHDSIEHTASSYYKCCERVLQQENTHLVVASHNGESISQIIDLVKTLHRGDAVAFAQLYSMADGVSFALAENGYQVYKYLPFGPVDMVIPYLIRRGQENSSVMQGATNERRLMWKELKRRIMVSFSMSSRTSPVDSSK